MRLLQRTFVQTQALRDGLDSLLLANHALRKLDFSHRKAIARVAKDHVARDSRFLRDNFDDVLRLDDHRVWLVDFNFHCGRVEPANRFIRQVQVANVFRGHLQRGIDGFIRNLDRIISFEAGPHAQ